MPGFLMPAIRRCLLIRLTRLGSLGRSKTTNFFRISQQRSINFEPITSLHRLPIRIGDHLAKNTDRTRAQVQLRKILGNTRRQQRSANAGTFRHGTRAQDLAVEAGMHHFNLDQRLSSAFCLARWQNASTSVLAAWLNSGPKVARTIGPA